MVFDSSAKYNDNCSSITKQNTITAIEIEAPEAGENYLQPCVPRDGRGRKSSTNRSGAKHDVDHVKTVRRFFVFVFILIFLVFFVFVSVFLGERECVPSDDDVVRNNAAEA